MKYSFLIYALLLGFIPAGCTSSGGPAPRETMGYADYAQQSVDIQTFREQRLVSVQQALDMMRDGKTLLIDVRDPHLYKEKHIEGAVNLSAAEITEENLSKIAPSKDTRIILYCQEGISLQPTRMVPATWVAYPSFYAHGYRNLYEIERLADQKNMQEQYGMIPFTGHQD